MQSIVPVRMLTDILSCCIAGIHTSGCDSRRYFLDQVAAGVERCCSLHFAVYKSSRHAKRREADRAEATRQAEAELSRQTGDVDCYKIYLKSMGLPVVTATLILVIISVAADKMPRKFRPRLGCEFG